MAVERRDQALDLQRRRRRRRRRPRPGCRSRRRARPGRPARPAGSGGWARGRWRPAGPGSPRRRPGTRRPGSPGPPGAGRSPGPGPRPPPPSDPGGRGRRWPRPRRHGRRPRPRRVSMFPRRPTKVRSGRWAASWERRRAEPVAMRDAGREVGQGPTHQRVSGVGPFGHGGDDQAVGGGRRQVLGRVDGQVGPPVEDGGLDLLDEDALAADLGQGAGPVAVAGGGDDDGLVLEGRVDGRQERGDVVGLPTGQGATAGRGPEPHRRASGASRPAAQRRIAERSQARLNRPVVLTGRRARGGLRPGARPWGCPRPP